MMSIDTDDDQRLTKCAATMTPTVAQRQLAGFLRVTAIVLLLASGAIVMPFSWMAVTHRWLGLGELPDCPIVAYLARSVSALYAYQGIISLFLSFDVPRYGPLIRLLGWLALAFGVLMIVVDVVVGMPRFWTVGEGPVVIALASVVLWLQRRAGSSHQA